MMAVSSTGPVDLTRTLDTIGPSVASAETGIKRRPRRRGVRKSQDVDREEIMAIPSVGTPHLEVERQGPILVLGGLDEETRRQVPAADHELFAFPIKV